MASRSLNGDALGQAQKVPKLFGYGGQRADREPLFTIDKARSLFGGEVSQPVEEHFSRNRVVVGL